MKKLLLLMVGCLLVAGVASASTILFGCTGVTGATGVNSFATTGLVCDTTGITPATMAAAGWTIQDVSLEIYNDFSLGALTNDSFTFTWTIPAAFTGAPATCVVSGFGGATNYTCGASSGPNTTTLFDTTSGTWGTYLTGGAGGAVASVSGNGLSLSTNGVIDARITLDLDYGPTGTTPEPMTMMLVGGGLLGLGLAASKLRKKA